MIISLESKFWRCFLHVWSFIDLFYLNKSRKIYLCKNYYIFSSTILEKTASLFHLFFLSRKTKSRSRKIWLNRTLWVKHGKKEFGKWKLFGFDPGSRIYFIVNVFFLLPTLFLYVFWMYSVCILVHNQSIVFIVS